MKYEGFKYTTVDFTERLLCSLFNQTDLIDVGSLSEMKVKGTCQRRLEKNDGI